ncbi:MAG: hypothetical protein D6724_11115 [Armatimonadetes bacterium]|nr:MAG: hypothetical protein D6724_11115 [Armatimonadota bacterium]GIV03322.1 MAG: hypothetical protein KatS3mg015_2152 [Fimbriimonadales bacterium]
MPEPVRRSDVTEVHWENAITWGILSILCLLVGAFFIRFGHDWGVVNLPFWRFGGLDLQWVAVPFLAASPLMFLYALYRAIASRKEGSYTVECPYCHEPNEFVAKPDSDFTCMHCDRRVAVKEGRILDVMAVSCGYCGAVNYLTDKTAVLICEQCGHEIPLLDPETGEMRHAPRGFARVDDRSLYELVLVDPGRDREGLILSLQHMLALTRNQVKDILEELPATLMTGINRRKAELLKAQLEEIGATAEMRKIAESSEPSRPT